MKRQERGSTQTTDLERGEGREAISIVFSSRTWLQFTIGNDQQMLIDKITVGQQKEDENGGVCKVKRTHVDWTQG